eukprot:4272404-Prymnesium_polylepis.1
MEHNRKVRAAIAENARRKISLRDYEQRSAPALATALDTSLRPNAASLLFRLQAKFKDGRVDQLSWALRCTTATRWCESCALFVPPRPLDRLVGALICGMKSNTGTCWPRCCRMAARRKTLLTSAMIWRSIIQGNGARQGNPECYFPRVFAGEHEVGRWGD